MILSLIVNLYVKFCIIVLARTEYRNACLFFVTQNIHRIVMPPINCLVKLPCGKVTIIAAKPDKIKK